MPSMPEHTPPCSSSPPSPGPDSEDDEIDKLMRSSPIPDDDEPLDATSNGTPADEHDSDSASALVPWPGVDGNTFQLSGVSRNEQAMLRRAAEKLKVHPYQRSLLQDFVKCSPVAREAQVMMAIFAIDNRLDQQAAAVPPFSVSEALRRNIKNFIIAVLLSAKLAAYKGTIPRDHVVSLIMKERLHIPHTFDRDPHASKVLKEQVNHELSQARGKLKKLIKSGNDKNIFDLATALVNGTSCSVTIQLCGRVALLRKMFKVDSTDGFWDTVDDELAKIRKKAAGDPVRVSRYFKGILEADQKAYRGNDPSASYTLPTSVTSADPWQLEVDSLLGETSGPSS